MSALCIYQTNALAFAFRWAYRQNLGLGPKLGVVQRLGPSLLLVQNKTAENNTAQVVSFAQRHGGISARRLPCIPAVPFEL